MLLGFLLASCDSGEPEGPTSDIVSRIPWPSTETVTYVLKDGAGRETARGTFTIATSSGATTLTQRYAAGGNSDEASVVVDSQTLKPQSATRLISGSDDDQEELQVTYTEQDGAIRAVIRQGDKQSGLTVPEHAYDNDSSLFLWRTIDFREGYEARYVTIITNRRDRHTVEIKVAGKEQVTVPAGQFAAWRLEIETENAHQVAWFADTAARTLVKYDNDRGTIWELATAP